MGWGRGMNQVRSGSSLGIKLFNEAGKNICKGSGKAEYGPIRDLLLIPGGGRGKQRET